MMPLLRFLLLAACWSSASVSSAGPRANHVFIISIDGGKPEVISQSAMPVLKRLAAEGAHTWEALTVMPSLTLPAHASMLTGLEPTRHKISWNDYNPQAGAITVPTIFSQAKHAGLSTAMFVGKQKFLHLVQPATVDCFSYNRERSHDVLTPINGSDQKERSISVGARVVAEDAARHIRSKKPHLCFIHLTDPDDAGHEHGWGSPQQKRAFEQVDAALAVILNAIEQTGLAQDSVILITADHGGHGHEHGSDLPDDMKVPWVAWGKSVRPGAKIEEPVMTCDTAATALWILNIPWQGCENGKPVITAFRPNAAAREQAGK